MHLLTVIQTPLTHYGAFCDIKVWRGRGELCHLGRDRDSGVVARRVQANNNLDDIEQDKRRTSCPCPALKFENIPENDWDRTRYDYRRRGPNGY